MKVEFRNHVPKEFQLAIEPIIERWKWLLPPWLHLLVVTASSDQEPSLSITVDYEYRWAYLYIHPGWIGGSDEMRERNLVHELMHIHLARIHNMIDDLANRTMEEGSAFRQWAENEWDKCFEATVTDLQHVIMER